MKKVFKWAKGQYGYLLLAVIFTCISPLTYSYVPQFIKYVIDKLSTGAVDSTLPLFLINFFEGGSSIVETVIRVAVVLVVFQALRALVMVVNALTKGIVSENIALAIRTSLYDHINELSYFEQNRLDSGDTIQRCTSDVDTMKGFMSNAIPQFVYIFASMGAGMYQMASINIYVMLITLAIVPINLVTCYLYFKKQNTLYEKCEESESKMTSVLEESVNGVRVVKAFNQETREIQKFHKSCETYSKDALVHNMLMSRFWGFSDGLSTLQYGITTILCVLLAMKGKVSTGDIIASFMYISMLIYPIRSLGRIIADMGKAKIAAGRIDEILDKPSEFNLNGTEKPEITGNIKFDHVSFQFEDASKPFLNDVSFEIKEGETVAIVGKTGSGKSTIALLLERMLEYKSGSITINGVELKDIEKKHLRSHLGIVLQDPFLYTKTIFDNIKIASPNADSDRVFKAAKSASIDKEIKTFDSGYDTLVGEKGVTLSGGQKQRVAIARMLILNKPIVIFDDSLSAVDTETDADIRKALKKEDRTLTSIIITHRITTAKEADKIIVIENGKISNIGTHDTLAKIPGLYKTLWDIQGSLEGEFTKLVKEESRHGRRI